MLALVANALPKSERRAVRRALQEARRGVSVARDHAVAPETLALLTLGEIERATAGAILATAAEAMPALADIKQLLAEGAARAAAQVEALEAALPQTIEWSTVLKGVRASYDAARRARGAAKGSKRGFHTWRRRSKELTYQLEVLAGYAGFQVGEIHRELAGATDTQGPAVDLIMVRDFIRTYGQGVAPEAFDHLMNAIDVQLDDLMKDSRAAAKVDLQPQAPQIRPPADQVRSPRSRAAHRRDRRRLIWMYRGLLSACVIFACKHDETAAPVVRDARPQPADAGDSVTKVEAYPEPQPAGWALMVTVRTSGPKREDGPRVDTQCGDVIDRHATIGGPPFYALAFGTLATAAERCQIDVSWPPFRDLAFRGCWTSDGDRVVPHPCADLPAASSLHDTTAIHDATFELQEVPKAPEARRATVHWVTIVGAPGWAQTRVHVACATHQGMFADTTTPDRDPRHRRARRSACRRPPAVRRAPARGTDDVRRQVRRG